MPSARRQVNFQTRSPWQLASTLGFVLDRGESGNFMGLKPRELAALHECLAWGREPGNNPVLRFYGQQFEDFSEACRTPAAKWKHLLPTGAISNSDFGNIRDRFLFTRVLREIMKKKKGWIRMLRIRTAKRMVPEHMSNSVVFPLCFRIVRFFGPLNKKAEFDTVPGNNRVKVRMTGKDKVKVKESTLGATLGEEATGVVVVDYEVFLLTCLIQSCVWLIPFPRPVGPPPHLGVPPNHNKSNRSGSSDSL